MAAAATTFVLGWAALVFVVPDIRFVVLAPRAKTGFEVSLALLRFFAALVILLFPDERISGRLRWVALGFVVLGLGGLGFGYVSPLATQPNSLDTAMYGSLLTRALGGLAFAVGLSMPRPPALDGRRAGVLLGLGVLFGLGLERAAHRLPTLVDVTSLEGAAREDTTVLHGLTSWHWALSMLPLALGLVAVGGVLRHIADRPIAGWLIVAMVLMAGTQLHTMLWPSAYSPILTTASVLRLAFTLVAALGAVFTLRQVAVERSALLAAEADLARRRAEFTAMVAHELASPVAVIRGYAAMLATGKLDRTTQVEAAAAIGAEAELLGSLIADVRAAAVERDDFVVRPSPVALTPLLAEAAAFARTLPGAHPVAAETAMPERVLADPERISQVLRNLLGNAARHTPPGTPIALRAEHRGDRMRIMVADRGPGIAPVQLGSVFETDEERVTASTSGSSGVIRCAR